MGNISVIILTKNEEKNIERAMKSVQFCDEIIIVDDGSTDKTLEICQNSKVKTQIFKRLVKGNFAEQRNRAMTKASNKWILFLDADEEITPELQKEIMKHIQTEEKGTYLIKRRDFFWGKELKYGETEKVRNKGLIRLIKKGDGLWKGAVHEEFVSNLSLQPGEMEGFINHFPHQTLKEFIEEVNIYSDVRARELFSKGFHATIFQILFFPFVKFNYNYFVKRGFLDGAPGFVYAFLMSFHSFLVRTKLFQMQNK